MLTKIYKTLHKKAEISYQEVETIKYIKSILNKNQILFKEYKNGLIAKVENNFSNSYIGFRTELDALDIKEQTGVEYKGEKAMHACGHDMHMSVILGICLQANKQKEQLNNNVLFIFQRGEEGFNGACNLINEVKFQNIEKIIAFHNSNVIDINKIGLQNGQINSHIIDFEIIFKGKSSHVAQPYLGSDALNCALNFINLIKQNLGSNFGSHKQFLINFSNVNTNNAINCICDNCVISGTIRIGSLDIIKQVESYFEKTLKLTTKLNNVSYKLETKKLEALINDSKIHEELIDLNLNYQTLNTISSGGDDFALYKKIAPIYLIKLGSKWDDNVHINYPGHSNKFLPNYNGINYGVEIGLKILGLK